ncbi:MAG: outer rane biosis protein BamB [Planctomycetaceae bacterium]|nr:outer rane biosis protein BamB [Planctomycetaceae bacterium]
MSSLLLIIACMASGFGAAPVADSPGWPQWRGPAHNGISAETGIANSWPAEGPPVLWVKEIGQGYSGFIAVGDKVYTQTQTLYEQAVICLEAKTGRTVWSYRYGWPYDGGGLYPGPRATPAWYQNRIYFAAPDGTVGCLNADDGKLVWSKNPKQQYHGQGTDFGCACSPLVVEGKLIVPVGGRTASVVALNAENGEAVWASGEAPASYCTPVPITFGGRTHVVTLLENSLAAFDLQSGKRLWNLEFSQGYDEHAAAPLYQEPHLMIAGPFRSGAKLFRITAPAADQPATAEHTVKPVWENLKFSNDVASSVLLDGCVYGFDLKDAQSRLNRPSRGEFRCLDFATGKVKWSTTKVGQANIIVADGKLILFNDNGELILARADPEQYTELARTTVFRDEICWTPAALHNGRLFLRTQSRAVCLYLGDKPLTIEESKPTQSTNSVAKLRSTRFINSNRLLGGEREYPATTPEWDEFWLWYKWSLGAVVIGTLAGLLVAAAGGCASWAVGKMRPRNQTTPVGSASFRWGFVWRVSFWLTVLLCGICGSAILNPGREHYLFSWPLALWSVFQITLNIISWSERQPDPRQARWWSRGAGLGLLAASAFYFHVCRSLGMSIEWAYLIGFLPAFPVAALCSRVLSSNHRYVSIADPVLAAVSFTSYFWACAWFMKWWLVVGS